MAWFDQVLMGDEVVAALANTAVQPGSPAEPQRPHPGRWDAAEADLVGQRRHKRIARRLERCFDVEEAARQTAGIGARPQTAGMGMQAVLGHAWAVLGGSMKAVLSHKKIRGFQNSETTSRIVPKLMAKKALNFS